MQTFGIDISIYQKGMDLSQAVREGVQFAIIKAGGTEIGYPFKDSQFENFYKAAESIGLPVGCYFFAKCSNEAQAIEEAKYFVSIIAGKKFPVKCWYDIEGSMGSLPSATLNAIAKAFCKVVNESGFNCGVYANASTFKKIDFDGSFSALYPKWVASWGKGKPASVIDGRDMWQFGGETNLIRSNKICGRVCDQDYCYFEIGAPTPAPVPTPTPTPESSVASPTLLPGSTGPEVVKLQKNLNKFGFRLAEDGKYGNDTSKAVAGFQTLTKIGADGKYGPQTAAKMKEFF